MKYELKLSNYLELKTLNYTKIKIIKLHKSYELY